MHAFTVTDPPKWDPHIPILNTCCLPKYYSISRINLNATFLVILFLFLTFPYSILLQILFNI